MTSTRRGALRPLAALLGLALAPLPAHAAPAVTAAPSANAIIPVPLNPVIPAAQRTCAAKAASGVGTTILLPGTGAKPGETDYVLVNYIGYLAADGTVFDQNTATPFPLNGVVKGFSEGLRATAKGGITRICVPAALGYADKQTGPIPANSDLVFQVELVDFKTAAEVQAIQAQAPQPQQ